MREGFADLDDISFCFLKSWFWGGRTVRRCNCRWRCRRRDLRIGGRVGLRLGGVGVYVVVPLKEPEYEGETVHLESSYPSISFCPTTPDAKTTPVTPVGAG